MTPTTKAALDAAEKARFFLSQDSSCHWYIVPVANQAEWYRWRDLDEEDETSWEPPSFATRVNGSYTLVTFTDPRIS